MTLLRALIPTALALPLLAACTENAPTDPGDPRALTVRSTDTECRVSAPEAPAGNLSFAVSNDGTGVTEFYLLAEDGLRILGEVENVGPGLERSLVVAVPQGSYLAVCKPGMSGEGIRTPLRVTASDDRAAGSVDDEDAIAQATDGYAAYVQDQSDQLLAKTEKFVRLYSRGRDDAARALYPDARTHWERIETVAESFGDLDPKMDAREADLEPGQRWTGWHRLEKDLWPQRAEDYTPLTQGQRRILAADLLANTRTLNDRLDGMAFTIDQIANGSRGLLEEVATGKITGEEEFWSRTDLWDFQANVDGARVAYEGVKPLLERRDPELADTLDAEFAALQTLLDAHRAGDGFVTYDRLSLSEVKALADQVNALSEPLSDLTAAILS